jgi:hypothetical protein
MHPAMKITINPKFPEMKRCLFVFKIAKPARSTISTMEE